MSVQVINHIYKFKRGTEEAIFKKNPVLNAGEPLVVLCDDNIIRLKIGDGKHSYTDLPFINQENDESLRELTQEVSALKKEIDNAGDTVFLLDLDDVGTLNGDVSDRITEAIEFHNPTEFITEGNVAIIRKPPKTTGFPEDISSYVYDGKEWNLLSRSSTLDNLVFDEDLIYTEPIGALEVPSSGHSVLHTTGKTLAEVLTQILVKQRNPQVTQPTVTLSSSNIGAFEVGSNVKIAFKFNTTNGSYEFGPNTGVTFTEPEVELGGQTIESMSGTFDDIQVTDDTDLVLTGSIKQSKGDIPYDNLGEVVPDSAIVSKQHHASVSTHLSAFRGWFYGYKTSSTTVDVTTLTSTTIRDLGSGAKKSFPASISTINMQQMFFAAPKGRVKSLQVLNSVNGAPQTVKKTTVDVCGANGYDAITYDVFYVSNDNANTSSATYTISIK